MLMFKNSCITDDATHWYILPTYSDICIYVLVLAVQKAYGVN